MLGEVKLLSRILVATGTRHVRFGFLDEAGQSVEDLICHLHCSFDSVWKTRLGASHEHHFPKFLLGDSLPLTGTHSPDRRDHPPSKSKTSKSGGRAVVCACIVVDVTKARFSGRRKFLEASTSKRPAWEKRVRRSENTGLLGRGHPEHRTSGKAIRERSLKFLKRGFLSGT